MADMPELIGRKALLVGVSRRAVRADRVRVRAKKQKLQLRVQRLRHANAEVYEETRRQDRELERERIEDRRRFREERALSEVAHRTERDVLENLEAGITRMRVQLEESAKRESAQETSNPGLAEQVAKLFLEKLGGGG